MITPGKISLLSGSVGKISKKCPKSLEVVVEMVVVLVVVDVVVVIYKDL